MTYHTFNINVHPTPMSQPFVFSHDRVDLDRAARILNKMAGGDCFTRIGNTILPSGSLNVKTSRMRVGKDAGFPEKPTNDFIKDFTISQEFCDMIEDEGYEIADNLTGYCLCVINSYGELTNADVVLLSRSKNSVELDRMAIFEASNLLSSRGLSDPFSIQLGFSNNECKGIIGLGTKRYEIRKITIPVIREIHVN